MLWRIVETLGSWGRDCGGLGLGLGLGLGFLRADGLLSLCMMLCLASEMEGLLLSCVIIWILEMVDLRPMRAARCWRIGDIGIQLEISFRSK